MNLSENQKELLQKIQLKMRRGDVTRIAKETGFTKAWVSKVLSTSDTETYNDDIVAEAVRIIEKRDQGTTKLLNKITAAAVLCVFACLASCNFDLYPGNNAANHSFHNKASLQRVADSLYSADSTKKCLVMNVKGVWRLACPDSTK